MSGAVAELFFVSRNELVSLHEAHLTDLTQACKREMRLLIGFKSGATDFDRYVREMRQMLSSKTDCIRSFSQHFDQFPC